MGRNLLGGIVSDGGGRGGGVNKSLASRGDSPYLYSRENHAHPHRPKVNLPH